VTDAIKPNWRIVTPKGCAEIVLTDGQNVTLHAPFPSPPGSPLTGMLRDAQHDVRLKVHGCRRIDAAVAGASQPGEDAHTGGLQTDCFEITGRWVSLSRTVRDLLLGR
jgi:hypothetical protein